MTIFQTFGPCLVMAGETPSPEAVAAAGPETAFSVSAAAICMTLLDWRRGPIRWCGWNEAADALRDKAQSRRRVVSPCDRAVVRSRSLMAVNMERTYGIARFSLSATGTPQAAIRRAVRSRVRCAALRPDQHVCGGGMP